MKNVCKRLFSLMLVMVLLVSIVPFQASAKGGPGGGIHGGSGENPTESNPTNVVVIFVDAKGHEQGKRTAKNVENAKQYTEYTREHVQKWFDDCVKEDAPELADFRIAEGDDVYYSVLSKDGKSMVFTVLVEKINNTQPSTGGDVSHEPETVNKIVVNFINSRNDVKGTRVAYDVPNAENITSMTKNEAQGWFDDCKKQNDSHLDGYKISDKANLNGEVDVRGGRVVYNILVEKTSGGNTGTEVQPIAVDKIVVNFINANKNIKGTRVAYDVKNAESITSMTMDEAQAWFNDCKKQDDSDLNGYKISDKANLNGEVDGRGGRVVFNILVEKTSDGGHGGNDWQKPDSNKKTVTVYVKVDGHLLNKEFKVNENDNKFHDEWIQEVLGKKYEAKDYNASKPEFSKKDNSWKVELTKKNNVVVKFVYDNRTIGDTSYNSKNADDLKFSAKDANELMGKALNKSELKDYQLKLDKHDKPIVGGPKHDGNGHYTYTIQLEMKRTEGKRYLTLYVDGNKKFEDKAIKVYSNENIKDDDDVFTWIDRATDRKYSKYDYKIVSRNEKNDKYVTIKLESRKSDNNRKYDIYLDIYTNGSTKNPAKSVKITNGVAKDGKVTLSEAKGVVKEYFTAKNNDGIDYEGLWLDKDKFDRHDRKDFIDVRDYHKGEKTVHIAIKADNVKAKSTGNPKTGDEIFVTVTVMAVSAMALAGAYILNKKRMAK